MANDLGIRKILDSNSRATANDLTTAEWYFAQNAITNNGYSGLKDLYDPSRNGALKEFQGQ